MQPFLDHMENLPPHQVDLSSLMRDVAESHNVLSRFFCIFFLSLGPSDVRSDLLIVC